METNAIRRAARRHAFQELARKHRDEFRTIYEREVKKAGVKPAAKKTAAKKTARKAVKKAA